MGAAPALLSSWPHAAPGWVWESSVWPRSPVFVLWKVSPGKPIPPAPFHIPPPWQHSQGLRAMSQLPSSPSLPLAPRSAERRVAPGACTLRGKNNNTATSHNSRGGKKKVEIRVAEPSLQQMAMQHMHGAEDELTVNPSTDRMPWWDPRQSFCKAQPESSLKAAWQATALGGFHLSELYDWKNTIYMSFTCLNIVAPIGRNKQTDNVIWWYLMRTCSFICWKVIKHSLTTKLK